MQQDVHRQYHQTLLLMHNPTPAAPTTGNGNAANVFDSDGFRSQAIASNTFYTKCGISGTGLVTANETYTFFTQTNAAGCTSPYHQNCVNAQPATPAPTAGTVTQPTCATAIGFQITGYSASTYTLQPV
jgi:hypothetical protein